MVHSWGRHFVFVCVLAVISIPNAALSSIWEPGKTPGGDWKLGSPNASPGIGVQAMGIGGLRSDIRSDLMLNPQDMSYAYGYLEVKIGGEQQKVKVSPLVLLETLEIVDKTDKRVFEVSLDRIDSGGVPYFDEKLNPIIGRSFFNADLEFAGLVQGGQQLPEDGGKHPFDEILQQLESDQEYRKLPL